MTLDLLQKRKDKLQDWHERYLDKYGQKATAHDIERFPKVKKLCKEIQTLTMTYQPPDASKQQDHLKIKKLEMRMTEPSIDSGEVLLPTPTKDRTANKGLFKSLSMSNTLKRPMKGPRSPNASKKTRTENIFEKDGWFRSAEMVKKMLPTDLNKLKNTNAFGIAVGSKKEDLPSINALPDDEEGRKTNEKLIIRKMLSDGNAFGRSKPKYSKSYSTPAANLTLFSKHSISEEADKSLSLPVEKDKSEDLVSGENSPNPAVLPSLPPSKNWRTLKRISTPLKKVVDLAMNGRPRAEIAVRPNMFAGHRILKRTASAKLELPSNYQDFLSKEEEKQMADVIRIHNPEFGADRADVDSDGLWNSLDNPDKSQETKHEDSPFLIENALIASTTIKMPPVEKSNITPIVSTAIKMPEGKRKTTIPRRYVAFDNDSDSDSGYEPENHDQPEDIEELEEPEETTRSKRKTASKKGSTKIEGSKKPLSKPKAKKNASTITVKEPTGWDSKTISKSKDTGNYRAFNLKSKYKGSAKGPQRMGKSKFYKTKKLGSYSYQKSDQQYLLAGYGDEEELKEPADLVLAASEEPIDTTSFICTKELNVTDMDTVNDTAHDTLNYTVIPDTNTTCNPELEYSSLFQISEKFCLTSSTPVKIDLQKALFSLTGFSTFRKGQEQVIRRILNYESSLLILPTGIGKSLCYQLPAFILRHVSQKCHSMVVVISPTISLMVDQLRSLPKGIRGACLSSAEVGSESNKVIEKLKNSEIDVLFISPERLRSDSFLALIKKGVIPKISFACIDEVHCFSEWSHNFRTSYLHLQSSLIGTLGVGCVLGLTGTATKASQGSICKMLSIDETKGVFSEGFMRDNLVLTVSMLGDMDNREAALMELLRSKPYSGFQSIIIYVMFQTQADELAQYLRVRNIDAESYHAGKAPEIRSQTQFRFLTGKLRLLTATVAFGMGINKPDIDAVIHFALPKSIENYIQETGRAGRDGRDAKCHVFLSRQDYIKHRSLVYSEAVDDANIHHFLKLIFRNKGKFVGINITECEKEFDMKEPVLATVMSHVELSYPDLLQVQQTLNGKITLYFNNGTTIEDLCKEMQWFWEVSKFGHREKGGIKFDLFKVANISGMMPRDIMSTFWGLQSAKRIRFKTEGRMLQALLLKPGSDVSEESLWDMQQEICKKLHRMEQIKVLKLDETYEMLLEVALPLKNLIGDATDLEERQERLKKIMTEYFFRTSGDELQASSVKAKWGFRDSLLVENQKICQMAVEIAIKHFIRLNSDCVSSGRTIARIFHGISTPKYPAYEWSKTEFWGKYLHFNHLEIARMGTKAILQKKGLPKMII